MPIFEYKCRECGKEFEFINLAGDDCPASCPCGSLDLERLVTKPRVRSGSIDDPDLEQYAITQKGISGNDFKGFDTIHDAPTGYVEGE